MRRSWQQRPPLAPEKNPLLGRWESLGSGQRKAAPGVSPEMANLANALLGGITGGMCDSMLGRGTIEFRPTGLLAIGRDGSERPMYRAECGGGREGCTAPNTAAAARAWSCCRRAAASRT